MLRDSVLRGCVSCASTSRVCHCSAVLPTIGPASYSRGRQRDSSSWSGCIQAGVTVSECFVCLSFRQLVKVEGDCAVSKGKLEVSGRKLEEQQHECMLMV